MTAVPRVRLALSVAIVGAMLAAGASAQDAAVPNEHLHVSGMPPVPAVGS